MLAIWLKFCPIFLYLPYEKRKNIRKKYLINEQAGKSANIVELKSKLNKWTCLFIRYLRVPSTWSFLLGLGAMDFLFERTLQSTLFFRATTVSLKASTLVNEGSFDILWHLPEKCTKLHHSAAGLWRIVWQGSSLSS